jgi:Bacterial regulatory proteins, luxR family
LWQGLWQGFFNTNPLRRSDKHVDSQNFGSGGAAYICCNATAEATRPPTAPHGEGGPGSNEHNDHVNIIDHASGQLLSSFGRAGHFTHRHTLAVDSKGNIYVAEVNWGEQPTTLRIKAVREPDRTVVPYTVTQSGARALEVVRGDAREVGNALGISTRTAEAHRTNIMRKLDIHSVVTLCVTPSVKS